jgi:hypothetical protein
MDGKATAHWADTAQEETQSSRYVIQILLTKSLSVSFTFSYTIQSTNCNRKKTIMLVEIYALGVLVHIPTIPRTGYEKVN